MTKRKTKPKRKPSGEMTSEEYQRAKRMFSKVKLPPWFGKDPSAATRAYFVPEFLMKYPKEYARMVSYEKKYGKKKKGFWG